MIQLGVSVYPDIRPIDEIEEYLVLASKYGFTRVFSSMFSVEGTKEEVFNYFHDLCHRAHKVNMQVGLDVNPACFEKMGAKSDDLSIFKEIGCDIVRMDMSFGNEGDLQLVNNPYGLVIEFNASMGAENTAKYLKEHGANMDQVMFGHNFYPQRYTGMPYDKYLSSNQKLQNYGIRIEGFVASHNENTHGVWDAICGLPTIEKTRDYPIELATRVLAYTGCSDILIGNAYASEEELKAMSEIIQPFVLNENNEMAQLIKMISGGKDLSQIPQKKLFVHLLDDVSKEEKEALFHFFPHIDFGDSSEWIWRSRNTRFIYSQKDKTIAPRKYEKEEFPRGSVVIVNDNYKHYAGEIQIALLPLINDGTRNLLGYLDEQEMSMLDVIQDGDIIIFKER